MKPLYVHVGLPRAGSTFFQNRIFAGKKGIQFLGKSHDAYPKWLMQWHYLSEFQFSRNANRIQDAVKGLCSDECPNVLSSEMFTMWGGRTSEQAERLHRLFPEARVLLILREPISRMLSFYKAIVERDGFYLPLKKMIDWKALPFVDYKRKPVQIQDFQYDAMVEAYRVLFGEDRVCVMRLEDMHAAPSVFWQQVGDFMGVPFGQREIELAQDTSMNASPESEQVAALRWQNFSQTMTGLLDEEIDEVKSTARARWSQEEMLPAGLRRQVQDALQGRCGFYYC